MTEPIEKKAKCALPHRDSRCGARWGGSKTSHCSRCHETFSTPANFDKHQRGDECLDPREVGLLMLDRAGYQAWGMPSDPDRWADPHTSGHAGPHVKQETYKEKQK